MAVIGHEHSLLSSHELLRLLTPWLCDLSHSDMCHCDTLLMSHELLRLLTPWLESQWFETQVTVFDGSYWPRTTAVTHTVTVWLLLTPWLCDLSHSDMCHCVWWWLVATNTDYSVATNVYLYIYIDIYIYIYIYTYMLRLLTQWLWRESQSHMSLWLKSHSHTKAYDKFSKNSQKPAL